MSSTSLRFILVDSKDEVFRLSQAKFERLFSRPPRDTVPKFAEQRVRAAEVAVELENGRPVRVLRVIFHYMHFDRHGRLDYERYLKDNLTVIEAGMPDFNVEPRVRNVIAARQRFAARRRDHSVWWRPTSRLQRDIMQAALDDRRYRRV
jgi:hypothetical protein